MVDIYDADNMRLLLDGNPKKKLAAFVFNFCVKNNWVLTELIPVETKLEDIFKELTTE